MVPRGPSSDSQALPQLFPGEPESRGQMPKARAQTGPPPAVSEESGPGGVPAWAAEPGTCLRGTWRGGAGTGWPLPGRQLPLSPTSFPGRTPRWGRGAHTQRKGPQAPTAASHLNPSSAGGSAKACSPGDSAPARGPCSLVHQRRGDAAGARPGDRPAGWENGPGLEEEMLAG